MPAFDGRRAAEIASAERLIGCVDVQAERAKLTWVGLARSRPSQPQFRIATVSEIDCSDAREVSLNRGRRSHGRWAFGQCGELRFCMTLSGAERVFDPTPAPDSPIVLTRGRLSRRKLATSEAKDSLARRREGAVERSGLVESSI